MLDELRGARLPARYRGRPSVDLAAVAELIVAIGELASAIRHREIDLNRSWRARRARTVLDALVLFY